MMSCRDPVSNNDDPQIFAADDPLLGFNIGNPGTQSAGYSSNMAFKDRTDYAWMKQLFPNALLPGATGTMKLEFDWYVFDGPDPYTGPDNNSPTVFPAPDGAGILPPAPGGNIGYPGSTSVGYSSNLSQSDPFKGAWIQKQFPNALPAGTYDVEWKMDRYVYSQNNRYGNRIMLLTGSLYDKPWFGIDTDPASQGGKRSSYWSNGSPPQGTWWIQSTQTYTSFATDGNIEIRLSGYDDTGGLGGQQTAAWDNMSLVFKEVGTSNVVWSTTDDFEDGLDGWTAMVELGQGGDPWYLGTKVYVLTDDLYDESDTNTMYNGQFQVSRWPGAEPDGPSSDWTWNGHWRHWVIEQPFITATGNIDVRLLTRQKYAGLREVSAWDNVKLSFILPCNVIRFDADDDEDVDQADFAVLQACFTGADDPDGVFDPVGCRCVNSDGDQDIDAEDVSAFEDCASGPGVAGDPTCDDALSPP